MGVARIFSGGGEHFFKKFSKISQTISKKYSKNIQKNQKIFKKYSKIFKKYAKNFKKISHFFQIFKNFPKKIAKNPLF